VIDGQKRRLATPPHPNSAIHSGRGRRHSLADRGIQGQLLLDVLRISLDGEAALDELDDRVAASALVQALGLTTAEDDTDARAPAPEAEPVGDEQAANLHAILSEAPDPKAQTAALCKWIGVSSIEAMSADQAKRAIAAATKKRAADWKATP